MMNFPNAPAQGQTFGPVGGYQYIYLDGVWRVVEASQNLTALPRNRIVNPNGAISQEFGDTASGTGGTYFCDQWASYGTVASQAVRSSGAVSPDGSTTRMAFSVQTAKPSLAAGDIIQIYQPIEGTRLKDLRWGTAQAKPLVLRFTTQAHVAGTYAVSIRNAALDRSWIGSFTIPAVATDTTFTLTIPGDTTGTWPKDTAMGMILSFCFACGTTYQGVPGWQAGDKRGLAGTANGYSITGGIGVTDVGLYPDPTNTGTPPRWEMPDEAAEFLSCQRYWRRGPEVQGGCPAANVFRGITTFSPSMRVAPAINMIASTVHVYNIVNATMTQYVNLVSTVDGLDFHINISGGTANNHAAYSMGGCSLSARM